MKISLFIRLQLSKNHYGIITVDWNRQKELDADPKAIEQIEFVVQLKKLGDDGNATDAVNDQSMFVLTISEKIEETRLKFSQESVTVLSIMANYQEVRVKLTITQLNKLKSAAKNKTRTTLKLTEKNFEDEELSHELFLTTRQTTKIRNAFANNMSTDIKLSKTQISKIIQSGGSFGSSLGNLGKRH